MGGKVAENKAIRLLYAQSAANLAFVLLNRITDIHARSISPSPPGDGGGGMGGHGLLGRDPY